MTTMDVGDRVNLRYTAFNADGAPTTATLVLTVTDPSGNTTTPSVTPATPNHYDASFTLSASGTWFWVWTASGNVVDVSYGSVTAEDPVPPPYVDLPVLKANLQLVAPGAGVNLDARDPLLIGDLNSASRAVEDYCDGRPIGAFRLARTATQRTFTIRPRVYCTPNGDVMPVDDIGLAAGLVVEVSDNGTDWTEVADVDLLPDNALAHGRAIDRLVSPRFEFRCRRKLRVTARWGWPRIPEQVEKATLLLATRLAQRAGSPQGVAGSAEWGLIRIPYLDPDEKRMLSPFKTIQVA